VRPSLNGDLNMDGVVNGNDIGIIISLGYYGSGMAPHGWFDGDLNGNGLVDGNDIGIIIGSGTYGSGSYGPAVQAAAAGASVAASAAAAPALVPIQAGPSAPFAADTELSTNDPF